MAGSDDRPGAAGGDFRAVVAADAVATGGIVPVTLDGHAVAVARDDEGHVRAFQAQCPHDKAGLSAGRVAGCTIICPRHLASFDLTTGAVSAGWRVDALKLYPARIVDGQIEVDAAAVAANPPLGAKTVWDLS